MSKEYTDDFIQEKIQRPYLVDYTYDTVLPFIAKGLSVDADLIRESINSKYLVRCKFSVHPKNCTENIFFNLIKFRHQLN